MIDWNLVGIGLTIAATLASSVWWLSGQFSQVRNLVFAQGEKILDKLEYHERHDDTRFGEINERFGDIRNDIWEMKVLAAQNVASQKTNHKPGT